MKWKISFANLFLFSSILLSYFSVIIISYLWIDSVLNHAKNEQDLLKQQIINGKKLILKQRVTIIRNLINLEISKVDTIKNLHKRNLAEETLRKDIIQRLVRIRLPDSEYIFAARWNGDVLIGPQRGINVFKSTDEASKRIVKKLIRISQEGGGFTQYNRPLFEDDQSGPKVSYVLPIERWHWYIGSGTLLEPLGVMINNQAILQSQNIQNNIIQIIIFILGLSVLLFVLSYLVSKKFKQQINLFHTQLSSATKNNQEIQTQDFIFNEFQTISTAVNGAIRQKNQMENAARKNEYLFRGIFNQSFQLIYLLDSKGRILKINNTAAEQFHENREDLIGKFIWESAFWSHTRRPYSYILDNIRNLNKNTIFRDTISFLVEKKKYAYDISLKSIMDDNRNINTIIFEARDIREIEQINESLRISQQNYEEIYNGTNEAIIILESENGDIYDANDTTLSMFGYGRDDLFNVNLDTLIADTEQATVADVHLAMYKARTEGPQLFECVALRQDGTNLWTEITAKQIFINYSRKILTVFRDISERKKIENLISDIQDRHRKIFQFSPDPILILKEEVILEANLSALILFGLQNEDEISGQLFLNYSPSYQDNGNSSEKMFTEFTERLQREKHLQFEWINQRKDGKIFFSEISMVSFTYQGETLIQAIIRDITKSKKMEIEKNIIQEQLIQAQKMEAIGTLAGGLAHDFNNVLGGIMGSVNLLNKFLDRENLEKKDKIFDYLQTIEKSSVRASNMIQQLLSLSRKQTLQMDIVDLNESIRHIQTICENSFPKSIDLKFEIADNLKIFSDSTQIEQAILNLCVNASHAMTIMKQNKEDEGGTLKLMANVFDPNQDDKNIFPRLKKNQSYVEMFIMDTGVGISKDKLSRIFDPFYTTKVKEKGTGLGLAMVYNIIKQHEGFIHVESEEGKGSIFRVLLPLIQGNDKEIASEKESSKNNIKGKQILIIDDEEILLNSSKEILEDQGVTVLASTDPQKGVLLFEENKDFIDLVILDMSMPVLSGLDAFRMIQGTRKNIKALITSGYSLDERIKTALNEGANAFLSKPYSASDLIDKVSKILQS